MKYVDNLQNMRRFYLAFSIYETPSRKLQNNDKQSNNQFYDFTLSWSHYLILMRIENPAERNFYEIEASQQNWSEPQLKRQYHSSLYERLALSRNKGEVMKLANEGQIEIFQFVCSFPGLPAETYDGLYGLLADNLPDKFGHKLINTSLAIQSRKTDSMNPIEILCYIGKRGMGALEFLPQRPKKHDKSQTWSIRFLP